MGFRVGIACACIAWFRIRILDFISADTLKAISQFLMIGNDFVSFQFHEYNRGSDSPYHGSPQGTWPHALGRSVFIA